MYIGTSLFLHVLLVAVYTLNRTFSFNIITEVMMVTARAQAQFRTCSLCDYKHVYNIYHIIIIFINIPFVPIFFLDFPLY